MKICTRCEETKPLDQFRNRKASPDGKEHACKDCRRKQDAQDYKRPGRKEQIVSGRAKYRERNYAIIKEHLESHPCVDCEETDLRVLEFDHVRGEKKHNIAEMWGRGFSTESLLEEIAKCDVRCANCHRKRTATQFSHFAWMNS